MFRYDLHVHTSESSRCASSNAADMVDRYKSLGFDGIVITDHFYTRSSVAPREAPWEEFVFKFKEGFRCASRRGNEVGLKVFYGWEYTYHESDYLTLGLDNDWLLAHPEVRNMDIADYTKIVHEAGGYIIHAHPFREASYISYFTLLPRLVDAVEVNNGDNSRFENERAYEYAKSYDLTMTGGTDNHSVRTTHFAGIETENKINTIFDLIDTFRKREHKVFEADYET